ncbi:hypothetical protein ASE67_02420 [Sphingomonas sp. Leaf23]|uniref:tyrosine-type recombinase/integrase n=1 Tax=Sphingomonas sp. Leaf23 TaxID=1735689 RepID=UPI0007017D64|nr:tyrosine-type recombinase/integrase [Sphingomonas sp. Leaf23]KQM88614.1 hypothetical protein ASE67_02420 [Sphingomonas sp. Leaf23]
MPRHTSPCIVDDYWLDKRRDGASPDVWQITCYKTGTRQVVYRSTRKRSLDDARDALHAFVAKERAKRKQQPEDAQVVPMLWLYWSEKGARNINADQTGRSLRTFVAFLLQDEVGGGAVVTDLVPALFHRFIAWRMGPHAFDLEWDKQSYSYKSEGVSADTVDRNLNDIRAGVNHAESNMRIPYAPKIPTVPKDLLNPLRERVLTLQELGRIAWYAKHYPHLFRFVALQVATSVRPMAAMAFDPKRQYDDRYGLIDLQPEAAPRTKKRNAIVPAIRPMRVVLRAWAADPEAKQTESIKTAWRIMRRILQLSDDVFPKTIRHTIATWLYNDDTVPERQIAELLGHEGNLRETTKRYVKYDPQRLQQATKALARIWLQVSREARKYSAVHLLSKTGNEQRKVIHRPL